MEAVDRNEAALAALSGEKGVTVRLADLENGPWPYGAGEFAGIVVTNYLFRPRLDRLMTAIADPGVLIYETFMLGNEHFGKPSNPDFLLKSQELLNLARAQGLRVVAYEEGEAGSLRRAMVQRLCAVRGSLPVLL